MFFVDIQIEGGERLPVQNAGMQSGGKPILSFLMSMLTCCDPQRDAEMPSELAILSARARSTLCAVCASLMRATINGDWDYCEGEQYQAYQNRTGDADLNEEEFETAAAHYMDAWTDIHTLIAWVQTVVIQLEIAPRPGESQLLSDAVLNDFRALHTALDTALARGAKRARIDIH